MARQLAQRLAFVCFAGSGLAFASAAADSRDLLRNLNYPAVSGWAIADFDGDSKIDLAAAESSGRNARGFRQEVQIHLGASRQSSFTFSSRSARVQVNTRDLDGDHDRDIVIREALSLELVGVWLNDGFGNFTEGDASQFPAARETQRSMSVQSSEPVLASMLAILEDRIQADITQTLQLAPSVNAGAIHLERDQFHAASVPSDLRGRSPPGHS